MYIDIQVYEHQTEEATTKKYEKRRERTKKNAYKGTQKI